MITPKIWRRLLLLCKGGSRQGDRVQAEHDNDRREGGGRTKSKSERKKERKKLKFILNQEIRKTP